MTLFFAQIREDPTVERSYFHAAKHILTIASGGCMALSLLRDHVDSVVAIDANPAQTDLLKAKVKSLKSETLDDFLRVLGEHSDCLMGSGLLHQGINEAFYRFVGSNLRRVVLTEKAWQDLWQARDVTQRADWLKRYADTPNWRTSLDILLSRATHEHFFGKNIFANIQENAFAECFLARFHAEVLARSVHDNPFLSQLIWGRYQESARPWYLSRAGFAEVKRNLHKLQVITASLADKAAMKAMDNNRFDALTLSNVFDWADEEEHRLIVSNIKELAMPRARILVRQMLDNRPLPFDEDEEATKALPADRTMLYRKVVAMRMCDEQ